MSYSDIVYVIEYADADALDLADVWLYLASADSAPLALSDECPVTLRSAGVEA